MAGDLDLCVKKRGEWSIYQIYQSGRRSDAMKDAAHLKSTASYDAVMLLDDSDGQVLFSYVASGKPSPSYKDVKKGLDETSSKKMTHGSTGAKVFAPPKRAQPQSPPGASTAKKNEAHMALNVGIGGFIITMLTLVVTAQLGASLPFMGVVFVFMGGLTIAAATTVYSSLESNASGKKEAFKQLATQKKLQTTEDLLTDVFVVGKGHVWESQTQNFQQERNLALMLYMLGLSQGFKASLGTQTDATNRQVANLFSTTGLEPDSVLYCAANLPDYLVFPQYHAVYERGIGDAHNLAADPDYKVDFQSLFTPWYGPLPSEKVPAGEQTPEQALIQEQAQQLADEADAPLPETNFALVMFTDIVGSTDSIRNKGDKWMVDVLQAHNSIVREAIDAFDGHEVKHTGDGIMMSFPTVKTGVKASIAVQKGVARFNEKMPHRSFPLRVGMSAGEPMRFEGDLFGLPVNLAARVLPYADAHEIAMSEACHALCHDLPHTFTARENCNFKGFDTSQTVYVLNWQDENNPAPSPGAGPSAKPGAKSGAGANEVLKNLR